MKHLTTPFAKLILAAAGALTLGSCARADYAMLPKTSSYHGAARVSAPVAVGPAPGAVATPAAEAPLVADVPTPRSSPAPAVVSAPTAVAPVSTAPVAVAPVAVAPAVAAPAIAASASAVAVAPAVAPRKLNLVQRLAVTKVTKQLKKALSPSTFVPKQNMAQAQKISGNLRTGLILLLVGLLVGIFNNLIGSIIALVGIIFIVLWLLDNL